MRIESHLPPYSTPIEVGFCPSQMIQKVALFCLKEFACSLALIGAVSLFVPSQMGVAVLLSALVVQTIVSFYFNSLGTYAAYRVTKGGEQQEHYAKMLSICQYMTGANFALFTGLNTQFLIHETGHALAALSVYKGADIEIKIYPFSGGLTTYYKNLNQWGKKMGATAAVAFVVASGPGLTLLISSGLLALGIALKDKYPQAGKHLICWSLMDFLNHAYYAFTGIGVDPTELTHDFVHLSNFGLPPAFAMVSCIAIPALITLGMYKWSSPPKPRLEPIPVFV